MSKISQRSRALGPLTGIDVLESSSYYWSLLNEFHAARIKLGEWVKLGQTLFRSSVRKDLINGCMHRVSVCQCVSESVKPLVHTFCLA